MVKAIEIVGLLPLAASLWPLRMMSEDDEDRDSEEDEEMESMESKGFPRDWFSSSIEDGEM